MPNKQIHPRPNLAHLFYTVVMMLIYSPNTLANSYGDNYGTYPNYLILFNPQEKTKISGECAPTDRAYYLHGKNSNKQPPIISCKFRTVMITKDSPPKINDKDIEAGIKSLLVDKRFKGLNKNQVDEQFKKIINQSFLKNNIKDESDKNFWNYINRKDVHLKEMLIALASYNAKRTHESCNLFINSWELTYKLDWRTNHYVAEDESGYSNCGQKMISVLWKDPDLGHINVWNMTKKTIFTAHDGSYGITKSTSCKKMEDQTIDYYGGTYHKDKEVSQNYNPNIYVNCKWIDLSKTL